MSQAVRAGTFEEMVKKKKYPTMSLSRALYYAFNMPRHIGVIIYGEPGIGKTILTLKKAYEEGLQLGKEIIDTSLIPPNDREKIAELLQMVRKNPENYYVIVLVKLGATHPDDLMPLPTYVNVVDHLGYVKTVVDHPAYKLPMSLITVPGVYGCFILDDVTNVSEAVKKDFVAAVFNERVLPGLVNARISNNVRIIGTGNLPEHSELAHPLPEIMVGRAWQAVVEPDDLDAWYHGVKATLGDAFDDDVYVFLKRYPNYAQNIKLIMEAPRVGPVLRSWTLVAQVLKRFRDDIDRLIAKGDLYEPFAVVTNSVGPEAAFHFVTFLAKRVPSVEEALANPSKVIRDISSDLDITFRFVMQLAQRLIKVLKEPKKEESEQNKVDVTLEGGKRHTVSLDDPYVYLVLLANVMRETTSDVMSFALSVMDGATLKAFVRLVRSALMTRVDKVESPADAWKVEVKKAAELARKFIVEVGITDILLET